MAPAGLLQLFVYNHAPRVHAVSAAPRTYKPTPSVGGGLVTPLQVTLTLPPAATVLGATVSVVPPGVAVDVSVAVGVLVLPRIAVGVPVVGKVLVAVAKRDGVLVAPGVRVGDEAAVPVG